MPLYESEKLTLDRMKELARTHRCQCGGQLLIAWGGSLGHNCHMLRCGENIEHSDFVRPQKINNYDLPGYNMPGVMRRKQKEMMQKYGEEKTKTLVKIGGGNPIATLTQKGAADMLSVLYPDAGKTDSGRAAIIKGALICRDYGLNPAMDHIFLIMFKKKEGSTWVPNWSVVRGIKASRLICGREKSYGYIDDTPRIMTEEEQKRIYGNVDAEALVAICKLRDKDGNTFAGYGKWPRKKKDYQGNESANEPNGRDKGNSMFNMACIRAERQALDKLNPGAMPANVDVVDERFVESHRVTVEEIREELDEAEGAAPQITEGNSSELGNESTEETPPASDDPEWDKLQRQPAQKVPKAKREPSTVKTLGALFTACVKDWPEKFAVKDDVLKFLGKSESDITDPAEEYTAIQSKMNQ